MSRYKGYTPARRRANRIYYQKHRQKLLWKEKLRRCGVKSL